MRNTRLVLLVVAVLASAASLAGAQTSNPATVRTTRSAAGRAGKKALLRGITLTAVEKARVKEIHVRSRTEGKTLRETLKPAMVQAKAARQKGDTAAARAVLERTKGDREKLRALKARQTADIRSALSPEQQKQLDANVQQAAKQPGAKKGKGGKGRRKDRAQRISLRPNA
jgi:Spy/CpxP family protein refolding chaperone